MIDFLRPILARVIGSAVGAVAAYLVAKYGISIDADTQAHLIESIVSVMLVVFGVVYALIHKLINTRLNPGDAATPKLAERSKVQQSGKVF